MIIVAYAFAIISVLEKQTKITFNKTFIELWRLSYWAQVIKII